MNEINENDLFVLVPVDERETEIQNPEIVQANPWRLFFRKKSAIVALLFIAILILLSIFIPLLSPYPFDAQIKGSENIQPFVEASHPFGTDALGRDLLVRLMVGSRISLTIAIFSTIPVVFIGVGIGTISGYCGGWTDQLLMRIVDTAYAVPMLLMAILLSVVLRAPLSLLFEHTCKGFSASGPGIISVLLAISLLYWVDMARMVRGQVLNLMTSDYISAERSMGAGTWRIITRDLIPNCADVIILTAALNIPSAVFNEAFLSFIGVGVSAPLCSLGSLINDALGGIYSYPYRLIFPAVTVSAIILCFNLIGDGLRETFSAGHCI